MAGEDAGARGERRDAVRQLVPSRDDSMNPAAPESFSIRNFAGRVLVHSRDTGGALTVVEHRLPAGLIAMPLHTHQRETETTLVLEGTLWVRVGKRVTRAVAGTTVVKPAGVPHTFWNEGHEPARFLEMITPGGLEAWYAEIAAIVPARGQIEVERVLQASRGYGLEFDMESLMDIMDRHSVALA
jgi:quercetin dioxygenase-like cupin family protein